jgi:hypothetical protein
MTAACGWRKRQQHRRPHRQDEKRGHLHRTYTGGTIAANRAAGIHRRAGAAPAIWTLKPERKLFAHSYKGEPFDCLGAGVLNDMTATARAVSYFTMGGVYYANPQGVVSGPLRHRRRQRHHPESRREDVVRDRSADGRGRLRKV